VEIANATIDDETKAAADYFSALKPRSVIRVVEAMKADPGPAARISARP
jgi:hypothetical protein